MNRKAHSFFASIFPIFIGLVFVPLLLLSWYSAVSIRDFATDLSRYELLEQVKILGKVVVEAHTNNNSVEDLLVRLSSNSKIRLTLIARDGEVLFDSIESPAVMENHIARPEIRSAFENGSGSDFRFSHTLNQDSTYAAVRLDLAGKENGPFVLRSSLPLTTVSEKFTNQNLGMAMAMIWILIAGTFAAFLFSRRIQKPISSLEKVAKQWAEGDFSAQTNIKSPMEFRNLSLAMNLMAEQLQTRLLALKTSKEELHTIMTAMGEALIVTDRQGKVSFWNPEAQRLFGFSLKEGAENAGSLLESCRSPEVSAMEIRCRNGAREEQSLRLYHPMLVDVQIHGAPLPDNAGAVLVIADITRMVQLETVRKDFVANVSHELKTPIQSIRGFTETLLANADAEPADQQKFLEIIMRNTLRMEAIITDLLILARLENYQGQSTINKEAVNINQLVHAVISDLSHSQQGAIDSIVTEGPLDLLVPGNLGLLEQALFNLLDNALRYSPAKQALELSWEQHGALAHIIVRDYGPGIPLKDQDRIFERFYRVEKSRSRESGGTGLGLAIVRHIAQIHGGSIQLESSPGNGAKFTLILPRLDG